MKGKTMTDILISDSPKFAQKGADHQTVEAMRAHMVSMFGNTLLPPVSYKGEFIPVRIL